MKMIKQISRVALRMFAVCAILGQYSHHSLFAQEVTGDHEIRWIRVGKLHSWFSNAGTEVEYGRRGRAQFEDYDQADLLSWDAQYYRVERCVAHALWIGCTNFKDPSPLANGQTFPYKTVVAGIAFANTLTNFMPYNFKMTGKFQAPFVVVDGLTATDNALNDVVDEIDPAMKADRMVINNVHSNMGIDVKRKILGFSQQNHDDYFILDYVFKNTGIYDPSEAPVEQTLTDVYFNFQYRYAPGHEAERKGYATATNIKWGINTVSNVIGRNPNDPDFNTNDRMRAFYSYYAPSDQAATYDEDWGAPNRNRGGALAAPAFAGVITLHADTSPDNQEDDETQPRSTPFVGADVQMHKIIDSYNPDIMQKQYALISTGHQAQTHEEIVGGTFPQEWGTDGGGYFQTLGYGPYTLEPGDSIHIVVAEAVNGLSREKSVEVGDNWYSNSAPYTMPDGSTTSDADAYKKAWVWTAKDSLFETFKRARENYESGYNIPEPPPAPENFTVTSGGDRIILNWSENAAAWPNFDGYEIYRVIGRPDTTWNLLYTCDRSNAIHEYNDESARRGFDYFYYIVTKDDGSTNDQQPGIPLVSSKFYTMTNQPARLRRPAETALSEIRVVPNPYNIKARSIQFGASAPDRLAFYGLPPACTIKIYTERGDLVEIIEHTDGTGDELWESVTSSRQIVVSGVYIAYIEVTDDIHDADGTLLFNKGDNTLRKFVVIR